jgi:hypothetical protein
MDLGTIQPGQIQMDVQNVNTNAFRMVQGGNLLDKPTFGEKFMLGLKKFGAFFGRIAARVASFFPGFGTIASAGLYGVSDLAERAYQKQLGDKMNSLALDEAASQMDFQAITPGFGMFGSPGGSGGTGGGSPGPADGLELQKLETVYLREGAARDQIGQATFT